MQTAQMLAAIGLTEFGFGNVATGRSQQPWQAMAANTTGRRVALLVGINRYRSSDRMITPLVGCHQDTDLQQQLLQHSFGFPADQITTVLDEAATGEWFEAELQRLAVFLKPEDCFVLHFSGYGTQLTRSVDPETEAIDPAAAPTARAIVMADAIAISLNDLSDRLRSLPTKNVIATIDASYTPPTSYRQDVRSRVLPEAVVTLSRSNTTIPPAPSQTSKPRRDPASRPHIITYDQSGLSIERRWSDFDAGELTYLLTQSLWHVGSTSDWASALALTAERMEQALGSSPSIQAQNHQRIEPLGNTAIDVGLMPTTPSSAIGSVVSQSADHWGDLELWLGGLPPNVLGSYTTGSIVTIDRSTIALPAPPSLNVASTSPSSTPPTSSTPPAPPTPPTPPVSASVLPSPASAADPATPSTPSTPLAAIPAPGIAPTDPEPDNRHLWLRVDRDRGLRRLARTLQPMTENLVDRPVFEVVRVLPRSVQLGVALEPHLSRIERVDATSALSGLRGIEAIASTDREADCWFGCTTNCDLVSTTAGFDVASPNFDRLSSESSAKPAEAEINGHQRYTLLAFDRQPIFDCPLEPDEAIKRTIRRLQPRLQDLRAFKILAATENTSVSMLKVRLTYGLAQTDPTEPDRGLRRTLQTAAISTPTRTRDRSTLELPTGSRIQYRLENLGDQPLFFMLVRLDACGRLTVPETDEQILPARNVLTVPERPEATAWNVERDPGLVRLFAILSDRPFQQTRDSLARNHATGSRDLSREPEAYDLSGEVAEALVADLDRASRDRLPGLEFTADTYALDVRRWATLPVSYRIVPTDNPQRSI